jgi:SNF2 family DNA or RNA helicase
MNILHGVWIPEATTQFKQNGHFYLWVETEVLSKRSKPYLSAKELATFLKDTLPIQDLKPDKCHRKTLLLPTQNGQLLSSSTPAEDTATPITLAPWPIDCYNISPIIKSLLDIQLAVSYETDCQLGTDFLFWCHYVRFLKQIIFKDQYIPAMIYRALESKAAKFSLYHSWQWVSELYETALQSAVAQMPFACVAGVLAEHAATLYDKATTLRHFSEVLLHEIIRTANLPQVFRKKLAASLLDDCLLSFEATYAKNTPSAQDAEKRYRAWLDWRQKLTSTSPETPFYLGFQLTEASAKTSHWSLDFLAVAKNDPSFKVSLADYWSLGSKAKKLIQKTFGTLFEQTLLKNLGTAARMYPKIWAGLETATPTGLRLTLEEAFTFLQESAWILENAGFKIMIPAWWTPEGRHRMKIRLRTQTSPTATNSDASKNYLTLSNLVSYAYELAIGDEPLSETEWQQLVNAKTPLVQFRGQWMELERDKMQKLLDFWQSHGQETPQLSVQDLLKKITTEADTFEMAPHDLLADVLTKLRDDSKLVPIDDPPQLQATLRAYQKRGVAWLQYLDQLGLSGCLADDMGLGKTMQVITHVLLEKVKIAQTLTNLLIVPTSVIGNWQKEVEKFAPDLQVTVHHGAQRPKTSQAFQQAIADCDMVLTSYSLARKDEKLLQTIPWHRIILDEAQNIKNPQTAQTKAIAKLKANHRLALTGTPVENRLLDLWSIFNFLNPDYLGKPTYFRKHFELPIQRENDVTQSTVLKNLVAPLILRRLKTDKRIIQDLPDKVENKQYCNLTKEQASLYEAVVKEVEQTVEKSAGIERQGLILSTLMRLKQICNHPKQFLQDGSEFTANRSHKLERLSDMLEEVLSEQDSALIFTQFTEIGEQLEKYFKTQHRYKTYYLHGATPRQKRENMITEFQDPETEPAIFILSLKAGGIGVTLTKANHVFHFDRWWNPAVEDQATDRAFRIGQEKKVLVHKFITLGTLEERIDQMIEDKKDIAGSIVSSDESWLAKLDNQHFKALIALNKPTILEA